MGRESSNRIFHTGFGETGAQEESKRGQSFLLACKSSRTQLPEYLCPKTVFSLCKCSEDMGKGSYYGKGGKAKESRLYCS